jgi:hypothetical protein
MRTFFPFHLDRQNVVSARSRFRASRYSNLKIAVAHAPARREMPQLGQNAKRANLRNCERAHDNCMTNSTRVCETDLLPLPGGVWFIAAMAVRTCVFWIRGLERPHQGA